MELPGRSRSVLKSGGYFLLIPKGICGHTASLLADAPLKGGPIARDQLTSELSGVADRMDPIECSRICDLAIDILMARLHEPYFEYHEAIDRCVAILFPGLDSRIAERRARDLSALIIGEWNKGGGYSGYGRMIGKSRRFAMGGDGGEAPRDIRGRITVGGLPVQKLFEDAGALNFVLSDNSREQIKRRMSRMASSAGPGLEGGAGDGRSHFRRALPVPAGHPGTG